MSCFSSFFICPESKNKEHNFDVALNVIGQDELRIVCLNRCGTSFTIKITDDDYKMIRELQRRFDG